MPFLLLMPSYNQAHYITDAVCSVLAQDDSDWELWIVDNSTDNTAEVMHQFADPRIHFHHFDERMDPGTCLNWMLQQATGRDFSYIHTDNNLQPNYVRVLRQALAQDTMALAYCDMRVINESGQYTHVFRRGPFDLPRLLSADTLGVPFAATTKLAQQVGGFSVRDVADDVRFCVSAYGLAHYVHIPAPLVDYRLHGSSRTQRAGGDESIKLTIVELMSNILPTLVERGIDPLGTLARALRESLDDVDLFIEDLWYRKLSQHASAWWQGPPRLEYFFWMGLVNIPELPLPWQRRLSGFSKRISPWAALALHHDLHKRRHDLQRLLDKSQNLLLTWARASLGSTANHNVRIQIGSTDFRTIWAARQLERTLKWQPLLHDTSDIPVWFGWDTTEDTAPVLDCSSDIRLLQPRPTETATA